MSKINALDALNRVLENIGEEQVSVLTSLNTVQLMCFNKLNEAIQDVATENNGRWQFLECLGVIPMTTGSYQYTITALTSGSDLAEEDRDSFRQADSGENLTYITPQKFDSLYPKGIITDVTGYPDKFTKYGGKFVFNKQATATQNGKDINFRYWKHPTYYATATATGTTDIPEPFDISVIVNLATMKALAYLGNNEEAEIYKVRIYGDGRNVEGAFEKLKEHYSSPEIKPRVSYVW